MRKDISFDLTNKSINAALKELERFRKDFEARCNQYAERVAEYLRSHSQAGFDASFSDTIHIPGGGEYMVPADVTVTVEPSGDGVYMVVAHGEDAVWAEFGAGVYYNGPVGQSPNPLGNNIGFTIGSFGKNGAKQIWKTPDGVFSRGTPASMPMANALFAVEGELIDIAREVFG